MFREMRRIKQVLSENDNVEILNRNTSGVLGVHGDDGYPYTVPVSYVYYDGKVFFHAAKSGHKLDAIAADNKVSFCVVDQDYIIPEKYTTYFRSVILFGKASVLKDPAEKRTALEALATKYSPGYAEGRKKEIGATINQVSMIEISVDHMSGKEAIELVRAKL